MGALSACQLKVLLPAIKLCYNTLLGIAARLRFDVPSGYYIDLTELALDYGWTRQPAGTDWRGNERARNYWLFVKRDNLTWCQAMLEIYLPTQISGFNCEVGQ